LFLSEHIKTPSYKKFAARFPCCMVKTYTIREGFSYQFHTMNILVIADFSGCGNGEAPAGSFLGREPAMQIKREGVPTRVPPPFLNPTPRAASDAGGGFPADSPDRLRRIRLTARQGLSAFRRTIEFASRLDIAGPVLIKIYLLLSSDLEERV
jgi:hypothetical protein